jgi:hypothetical protein
MGSNSKPKASKTAVNKTAFEFNTAESLAFITFSSLYDVKMGSSEPVREEAFQCCS